MSGAGLQRRRFIAFGALGLALLLPAAAVARDGGRPARAAAGDTWSNDWDEGWDDFGQTLMQMQRESIASQEEQARESGRVRRRDEIEKTQKKAAAEHEAYFDAILAESQASLTAPAGVYYRKPGYATADGPGTSARTIELDGIVYSYDQGIFWLHRGTEYVVVTAPVGAVVDRLPAGATRIPRKTGPVWYFFGTFFREQDGAYEVFLPPAGLTVFYLPDGYTQEAAKGVGLYRFGEVLYKPVFIQGILAYQVVEP
jgi:hypothetical protein